MAKKAVTQVMEWLQGEVENMSEHDNAILPVERCRWAIKLLKRVDARDSQLERRYLKRKRTAKKPAKRS